MHTPVVTIASIISFLLQFTLFNWLTALALPWLAWEFQRRYRGNRPALVAVPFILIPMFSWIFGFILFSAHPDRCPMATQRRNRAALAFGFSFLIPPTLLAVTYVVLLAGLMMVPQDSPVLAKLLVCVCIVIVISSPCIPWFFYMRYRKLKALSCPDPS
jgi:hypothetical protein